MNNAMLFFIIGLFLYMIICHIYNIVVQNQYMHNNYFFSLIA